MSTIIRRTATIGALLTLLQEDLEEFDDLITHVTTSTDGSITAAKYSYGSSTYIKFSVNTYSDYFMCTVGIEENGAETDTETVWDSGSNIAICNYALVKNTNSLAIAFGWTNGVYVTNDFRLFLTKISNKYVIAINGGKIVYDNIIHRLSTDAIPTPKIDSVYEWAQLYPLGEPELQGYSPDIYIVRYSPFTQTSLKIDSEDYLLGNQLAIKLEANND